MQHRAAAHPCRPSAGERAEQMKGACRWRAVDGANGLGLGFRVQGLKTEHLMAHMEREGQPSQT